MIDIHNHVLINVDDGPKSEAEVLDLLKQAVAQGITDIIATPHHHSESYVTPAGTVYEKLSEVQKLIDENELNINVHKGQEIRVNADLNKELQTGKSISLNDSKYVLLELPFESYPSSINQIIYEVQMAGYIPIIAHPERCRPLMRSTTQLLELIERGALGQVTAGSVTGKLGESMQEKSLQLISSHLIHVVSSDAHHADKRPFELLEAYQVITAHLGEDYTARLKRNAEAVLNDRPVKVKPPQAVQFNKKRKKRFWDIFRK